MILTKIRLQMIAATPSAMTSEYVPDLLDTIADLERQRGIAASDMLRLIRGSLEMYPDGGGDIGIMRAVEKIRDTAHAAAIQAAADRALKVRVSQHDTARDIYDAILALTPADAQRLYDLRIQQAIEEDRAKR